uniref:3FTx-Hem-14 n=1 Tax=Hemiaspis signata TaxID=355698 RepID=R4G2H7_9SAUR
MKTLLLTLVVVTIVCLDLGDSLKCYLSSTHSKDCAVGEDLCYTETWCDAWCGVRGQRVELGCAATCPTAKPRVTVKCCSTDNCNTFPVQSKPNPRGLLSSIMDHP